MRRTHRVPLWAQFDWRTSKNQINQAQSRRNSGTAPAETKRSFRAEANEKTDDRSNSSNSAVVVERKRTNDSPAAGRDGAGAAGEED
jgi:hypothetical protein